uniref:Uncharacterized protein n=1 Tax=Rhizophora mucronata TaxID=61149 RepID=A0A2P2PD21_RHIMU
MTFLVLTFLLKLKHINMHFLTNKMALLRTHEISKPTIIL